MTATCPTNMTPTKVTSGELCEIFAREDLDHDDDTTWAQAVTTASIGAKCSVWEGRKGKNICLLIECFISTWPRCSRSRWSHYETHVSLVFVSVQVASSYGIGGKKKI